MKKNLFKSFVAIILGFFVVAILSIVTDSILEKLKVFPPQSNPEAYVTWMLALTLFYRSIYTIIGGYITAKLSPNHPMRHVIILMIIGGIGGVAGAINGWNLGNHWYPVSLAITGPIFVWIGGKLNIKKS